MFFNLTKGFLLIFGRLIIILINIKRLIIFKLLFNIYRTIIKFGLSLRLRILGNNISYISFLIISLIFLNHLLL